MELVAVAVIGVGVGFLSGLFGKGGSAVATPLLYAIGVPPALALAAPLPATIPSTFVASLPYHRERLVDRRTVTWSLAFGVPAAVVGALATRWVDGALLISITDVVLVGLGLRFALRHAPTGAAPDLARSPARLAAVAIVVGLVSGLLANSGGFLLAPLYIAVVRLPIKSAFASSLAVAAVLAVPTTIVHAALGHIDWTLVAVFGAASVPLALVGAKVAIRSDAARLERVYGVALAVLGTSFLIAR